MRMLRSAHAQALSTLREDSAVLKVRESDMALLKEVVEPARSKYQQARMRRGLCARWPVEDTA